MATKNKAVAVAVEKQQKGVEQFTVKVNEPARIKSGKYAGLVGVVLSIDAENISAQVQIQGVRGDEKIDALEVFYPVDLEPNK